MYKYYKELEEKKSFKTYFEKPSYSKRKSIKVNNVPHTEELLQELSSISRNIELVDSLIIKVDEDNFMKKTPTTKYSYEEWSIIGDFFNRRIESYDQIRECYYSLNNNMWDTYYMLFEILSYSRALILIYPEYKNMIEELTSKIKEIINYIKNKTSIVFEDYENEEEVIWPDAWYITPNGYLYNTGLGHKQGNLIYPLYHDIIPTLSRDGQISKVNYSKKIEEILRRGYITDKELSYYSNLVYSLPTILTKEIEDEVRRENNLYKLDDDTFERIISSSYYVEPNSRRSYQKNLITLVVGHLAAEESLYNSFYGLENNEQIERILELTHNELDDILVKFCGFSKVSSVLPKTITTSSINGIDKFREYLDRGWTLEIIPGIIFDRENKDIREVDFSSPIITRYIEKKQEDYNGKGKVLVYSKN